MANEKMYGCDINEFMDSVDGSHTDYLMAAMSVLSDSQELLRGDTEAARQAINRAKYLISEFRQNVGRDQAYDLSKRSK
jgi:hypothetical protein